VFPDAVCERLAIVGVTAADIANEGMRMSELAFGRTKNRSLLGTLNDFAFMAQSVDARRAESESPEDLMRFLLADPDPSSGRREPDRVDARGVPGVTSVIVASLRHSIVRERLGASRLPFGAARS
jgi:hypothetical protein